MKNKIPRYRRLAASFCKYHKLPYKATIDLYNILFKAYIDGTNREEDSKNKTKTK